MIQVHSSVTSDFPLGILRDPGDAPLAFWEDIEWDDDNKQTDKSILELTGDSPFKEDVAAYPYSVKLWLLYLDSLKTAEVTVRFAIYRKALAILPRSYKLWYNYLQESMTHISGSPITSSRYKQVNNTFEKCLIHCSKMPRIWLMYLEHLQMQPLVTRCRRCFDRCLQSLPITQHHRIWPSYIDFIKRCEIPVLIKSVYPRYLMLEPHKVGEYVDLLKEIKQVDEAASVLANVLNEPNAIHVEGKTSYQLWLDLCDIVALNPTEIHSIDVEKVLRSGVRQFTNEVARFWCGLANHYTSLSQFDKARDVYEEALNSVSTVYDFGLIFDAYAKFLESCLTNLTEFDQSDSTEVELTLSYLEDLLQRRALLLSSVKLRQNPHNVNEWLKRAELFENDPPQAIATFSEALVTIDPFQSTGKVPHLWIQFSKFYERRNDFVNARKVFERAVNSKMKSPEHLAFLWCSFIEFELLNKNYKAALELARRSVHRPTAILAEEQTRGYFQRRMCRSVKLWSLCLDLEESFGTNTTLHACIEKMFDSKVITPAQILNYTAYLEENRFWEEAFRTYERGISILRWPYVYDIWITYLAKFVSRYGGVKLERARELFEQALIDAPPHLSKRFYLMFAKLEEEFGLARHAIAVYDRAAQAMTDPEQMFEFYSLLVAKTIEFHGAVKARSVYEKAIERMTENEAVLKYGITLCLRYSNLEKSIGEIDRARAILQHCSQFCDPKTHPEFWQSWKDFEVSHGNEDLFREMLRIKRSVQAAYTHITPIQIKNPDNQ